MEAVSYTHLVIDKEKHNFIKEVILPGQPHVGGLAYDPEHKLLWYSSNINGICLLYTSELNINADEKLALAA